jgi:hypothetical protein
MKELFLAIIAVFAAVIVAGCAGGAKNCGTLTTGGADDAAYKCFNDAAANCSAARVRMDTKAMPNYPSTTVGFAITMEIKGGTLDACKVYTRYDDIYLPAGLTDQELQQTQDLMKLKGRDMSCTMNAAMISSTAGTLSSSSVCSMCTGSIIDLMKEKGQCSK